MNKIELFKKLKKDGLFWSYDKEIEYISDSILIEHTLKYGDFDDIVELFKIFNKRKIQKVWEQTMKYDTRFIKVNFLIARIFLELDITIEELKKAKSARFEKLRLFAT